MVSQSQVGQVDHIAPLVRTEQEVFWFDVAMMVASCVQTLNASQKLIHQHQSRFQRKSAATVPEKVFQVRSE